MPNSVPSSLRGCATRNPDGVKGGSLTRCAWTWAGSNSGCVLARTAPPGPGRWRAVDEHGAVLDVFLQQYRDTEAAKSFFCRWLGEYDPPKVIHTDKLQCGAALWELPVLHGVEHVQVVSTARCNNLIEQSHRPT